MFTLLPETAMCFQRFRFALLALLAATVSVSFTLNFAVPLRASPVLAQSPAPSKAQADRLLQQGIEQYQISQFEAALQSWQQALTSGKAARVLVPHPAQIN